MLLIWNLAPKDGRVKKYFWVISFKKKEKGKGKLFLKCKHKIHYETHKSLLKMPRKIRIKREGHDNKTLLSHWFFPMIHHQKLYELPNEYVEITSKWMSLSERLW